MSRKRHTVLDAIRNTDIVVTTPGRTVEINPVRFPVPGMIVEKTEIGVAKIGNRKALYLKVRLNRDV
jgi:hypothetical protein